MNDLLLLYGTDLEAAEHGRRFGPGVLRGDLSATVRSINSAPAVAAKKLNEKRSAPYHAKSEPVPPEVMELNATDVACAVLVDWTVNDDAGVPIACTEQTKREIFSDPMLVEFRTLVIGISLNAENFRPLPPAAANTTENDARADNVLDAASDTVAAVAA